MKVLLQFIYLLLRQSLLLPGSGDHDLCVPFTGSQAWTRSMGYKVIDEWRAWIVNNQVAGYVILVSFP